MGKALNLKKRLASYFRKSADLPPKIQKMLGEATRLQTLTTGSEIEALIKEAELIKRYRPKYNSLMRDDKNYFFVGITQEAFPRIFTTHQPYKDERRRPKDESSRYFGPFTSVTEVKTVLKLLRRVFPYCTCKGTHTRPCLNSEIGRCPGYCCSEGQRTNAKGQKLRSEYRKNIRKIIAVLSGRSMRLLAELKRRIKESAKQERYEEAARLRDQIRGLEGVFSHQSVIRGRELDSAWSDLLPKLQSLLKTERRLNRMEGYDISNISGTAATGSMVVFSRGQPDKHQYRKFKIRTVAGISDVDMVREVLERRFSHPEWPYPELIVIDGGKPQLGAALAVLRKSEIRNPPASPELSRGRAKFETPMVTALAKREEVLYTEAGRTMYLKRGEPAVLQLFQRIRDESHRFARSYHHKLRKKSYAQAR